MPPPCGEVCDHPITVRIGCGGSCQKSEKFRRSALWNDSATNGNERAFARTSVRLRRAAGCGRREGLGPPGEAALPSTDGVPTTLGPGCKSHPSPHPDGCRGGGWGRSYSNNGKQRPPSSEANPSRSSPRTSSRAAVTLARMTAGPPVSGRSQGRLLNRVPQPDPKKIMRASW